MTPHLLLFYLFATVAVAAAVMVIAARNPVHSVLFLILTFFNAAALFVLVGAEFLAMVLVVVYVGAVAVLFMFVVMMLNVNYVKMRQGVMHYLPIGGLVGLILLVELVLVAGTWTLAPGTAPTAAAPLQPRPTTGGLTNTEALGNLLYTEYFYLFQTAGVILLVAIIGAITLTLRERGDVRRQDIGEQVHRDRATAVELRKVKPRAGI
jgi:NADH-quinone oxidoreductase subunit J